jgi:hypothetical protein
MRQSHSRHTAYGLLDSTRSVLVPGSPNGEQVEIRGKVIVQRQLIGCMQTKRGSAWRTWSVGSNMAASSLSELMRLSRDSASLTCH